LQTLSAIYSNARDKDTRALGDLSPGSFPISKYSSKPPGRPSLLSGQLLIHIFQTNAERLPIFSVKLQPSTPASAQAAEATPGDQKRLFDNKPTNITVCLHRQELVL
jgi:hypothetical protein